MSAVRMIITVHNEPEGMWAEVVDLPGCYASGKDFGELVEGITEAVNLYLQDNEEAPEILRRLAERDLGRHEGTQVFPFKKPARGRRLPKSTPVPQFFGGPPTLEIEDLHARISFQQPIEA